MLGDYSHLKVNKVTQILWVNLTIMEFFFYTKNIPVLKMEIHG